MAQENDIVLVYFEDKPLAFARIEDIRPDYKKDWYHVKLLLLQLPLQTVTWILRNAYINGSEFTMGGKRMRLELIECPDEPQLPEEDDDDDIPPAKKGDGKVISLKSARRRK